MLAWMMNSPSKLDSIETPLFLDASAIINIVATGCAKDILTSMRRPVFMDRTVVREFSRDPRDGSCASTVIKALTSAKCLELTTMSSAQFGIFLELTGASPPDDLGDGEAATLASAVKNGCAVIDEKKAIRISTRDFPALPIYFTVDLLCAACVEDSIGPERVKDALFNAMQLARMRLPLTWRDWIRDYLGRDRYTEALGLRQNST